MRIIWVSVNAAISSFGASRQADRDPIFQWVLDPFQTTLVKYQCNTDERHQNEPKPITVVQTAISWGITGAVLTLCEFSAGKIPPYVNTYYECFSQAHSIVLDVQKVLLQNIHHKSCPNRLWPYPYTFCFISLCSVLKMTVCETKWT